MKVQVRPSNRDLIIYKDGKFLRKIYWEHCGYGGIEAIETLLGYLFPDLEYLPEECDG